MTVNSHACRPAARRHATTSSVHNLDTPSHSPARLPAPHTPLQPHFAMASPISASLASMACPPSRPKCSRLSASSCEAERWSPCAAHTMPMRCLHSTIWGVRGRVQGRGREHGGHGL